jgi:creatinine amidohydrolase
MRGWTPDQLSLAKDFTTLSRCCMIRENSTGGRLVKGKYLERMTWPEVEAAFRAGATVVIPLGAAAKEHGLHLPMNNDWVLAEYFARRVAEALDVLVMPAVGYSFYPAFVEYPGSVCLRRETARDLIVDICRSLHAQGAPRFYVLNTGYSTRHPLADAQAELARDGIAMEYTRIHERTPEEKRLIEQPEGSHADEAETSMMLYIAPEIVRPGLAKRDIHARKGDSHALTRDPSGPGVHSPTGAYGDPTLASLEKGRAIVEERARMLVSEIARFGGT